jgi:Asp-tRNA(Asn)/Glu-tRNA(Gln) amidotransferase A subunit family amidase
MTRCVEDAAILLDVLQGPIRWTRRPWAAATPSRCQGFGAAVGTPKQPPADQLTARVCGPITSGSYAGPHDNRHAPV